MLLSDFLGGAAILGAAIDVNGIYNGMARSVLFPKMALKQCYFVDACRADFEIFRDFPLPNTAPIFDAQFAGQDDRIAPIYFASMPGHVTLADPGHGTRFGEDLLVCLKSGGAENVASDDGDPHWAVTVASLAGALEKLCRRFNAGSGGQQSALSIQINIQRPTR